MAEPCTIETRITTAVDLNVDADGNVDVDQLEKTYRAALTAFKRDKTNKELRRARSAAKKRWDAAVFHQHTYADPGALQLLCKDCSQHFIWTTEEQQYYRDPSRDWNHQPSRCRACAEVQKGRRRNNTKNSTTEGDEDLGTTKENGPGTTTTNNEHNSDGQQCTPIISSSSSSSNTKRGGKGRNMCYAFQRGECKWGNECKFNHDPDFAGGMGKKRKYDNDDTNADAN